MVFKILETQTDLIRSEKNSTARYSGQPQFYCSKSEKFSGHLFRALCRQLYQLTQMDVPSHFLIREGGIMTDDYHILSTWAGLSDNAPEQETLISSKS